MQKLADEQEILMALADMVIKIYNEQGVESSKWNPEGRRNQKFS